jgi:hypothetical protein
VITAFLLFSTPTEAATISRKFCYDYSIDMDDVNVSVGDDYITNPLIKYNARFAYASITDETGGFPAHNGYLDSAGCTPLLTLDDTHTYTARLLGWVSLPNGQKIVVRDSRYETTCSGGGSTNCHNLYSQSATVNTFPGAGFPITVELDATGPGNGWINAMLIATHAIQRKPAAWVDEEDYVIAVESTSGGAELSYTDASGTLLNTPAVLLPAGPDTGVRKKYVIAHELGHMLEFKLHCDDAGVNCDGSGPYRLQADYNASDDDCDGGVPQSSHTYNSKEYQSAAAIEGWAHYVAAFSFNHPGGSTCRMQPTRDVEWNYTSSAWDEPFSCEGAETGGDFGGAEYTEPPISVTGRDVYGQFCEASKFVDDNRGLEYDWLRFWWDFNQASGFGFIKATDVVVEMGSDDWCADDSCAISDLPASRLEDAMTTLGWSSLYNSISDNGVDR